MSELSVGKIAEKWYKLLPFPESYDAEFYEILEKNAALPHMRIAEYNMENNGFDTQAALVMFLYFFEELSLKYRELDIPDELLLEAIKDIVVCAQRCKTFTGKLGLDDLANWMMLPLSLKLFRLGRYQFAMSASPVDVPDKGIKKGDNVLDIHIPGGEKLCVDKLIEEMKTADEFFSRYFPDFEYKYFTCYSWLLDDTLKQLLNENSNIIKFQNLFDVVYKDKSDAIFRFMYKFRMKSRDELLDWQPETGFAEKVKNRGLNGGDFYEAFGLIEKS